jgi:hypothetical protein
MSEVEEITRKVRRHGFECPWSVYQTLSYTVAILMVAVLIFQILPGFDSIGKTIIICFLIVTLGCLITFDYKLTVSDPTDLCVVNFKSLKDLR